MSKVTNEPEKETLHKEAWTQPRLGSRDFLWKVHIQHLNAGPSQYPVSHCLDMARSKRRTTRSNPQKSRERSPELEPLSPLSARSSLTPIPVHDEQSGPPEQAPEEAQEPVQETPAQPVPMASEEDACPACKDHPSDLQSTVPKESWIRCDACKSWYHWVCAGNGADVDTIDKWQVYAKTATRSIRYNVYV